MEKGYVEIQPPDISKDLGGEKNLIVKDLWKQLTAEKIKKQEVLSVTRDHIR